MPQDTLIPYNAAAPKRRRLARPLDLFGSVPEARTAEAMDDRAAAEQLMDDILALVQAGLIAPVEEGGTVRYAPADPDNIAA